MVLSYPLSLHITTGLLAALFSFVLELPLHAYVDHVQHSQYSQRRN